MACEPQVAHRHFLSGTCKVASDGCTSQLRAVLLLAHNAFPCTKLKGSNKAWDLAKIAKQITWAGITIQVGLEKTAIGLNDTFKILYIKSKDP